MYGALKPSIKTSQPFMPKLPESKINYKVGRNIGVFPKRTKSRMSFGKLQWRLPLYIVICFLRNSHDGL